MPDMFDPNALTPAPFERNSAARVRTIAAGGAAKTKASAWFGLPRA